MTNPSLLSGIAAKTALGLNNMAALTIAPIRRAGNGGRAWSLPMEAGNLRQPQDGAPGKLKLTTIRSKTQTSGSQEPEDAKLTGGTRSLARRLLGLSFGAKQRRTPSLVAGPFTKTRVA